MTRMQLFSHFKNNHYISQIYLRYFVYGLFLPLGFAPFHMPGMALLSLLLLYHELQQSRTHSAFLSGLFFGLGFFGLGTSWIYVSIHEYGHLHSVLAAFITLLFLLYLAGFIAIMSFFFTTLKKKSYSISSAMLFAVLWTLGEFARSSLFTGFPWLLIGHSQFDAPGKFLLPVTGVFGCSLISCFAAALAGNALQMATTRKRILSMTASVFLILSPGLLKNHLWTNIKTESISIGVIQANLSMRDKWDETLFWQLIDFYDKKITELMSTDLIVLPESAIPLPASYVKDFLENLDEKAKNHNTAVLLGIPESGTYEDEYFNALVSFGSASGTHYKEHLVPFGEYIPAPFEKLIRWLDIPDSNLKQGLPGQPLIQVKQHAVASLVCYESAYAELLRHQLPEAEWIVSISDDGWFGHSFAMYQQQQIAQALSVQTGRYQIMANNDGLSSIINTQGEITASLPAFTTDTLKAVVHPAAGMTPWVYWGDAPTLVLALLFIGIYATFHAAWLKGLKQTIAAGAKRRYPYQPD